MCFCKIWEFYFAKHWPKKKKEERIWDIIIKMTRWVYDDTSSMIDLDGEVG